MLPTPHQHTSSHPLLADLQPTTYPQQRQCSSEKAPEPSGTRSTCWLGHQECAQGGLHLCQLVYKVK
ncbi:hypothetical protein WJX79_006712 [Trebouxia sp. C0005]